MSVHSLRDSVHNAFATIHLFRVCERSNLEINVSLRRRCGQNRVASELTWNFNISSSILRRNWAGRVIFSGFTRFERRALRKSVSGLVFLLVVETYRTITRRNRIRSAQGASKQQRIQHSNRVSRFYSQNIRIIGFSSKAVAFPYKPL